MIRRSRVGRARGDDRGATIVEFIAGAGLLILLLLAVIQVTLFAYAGTVARHAAYEGAREGALIGSSPERGGALAESILANDLGRAGGFFVVVSYADPPVNVVLVEGDAPRVLPFGPSVRVKATARVALETEAR